ncbi:hypothetical protein CC85DRAFT_300540 [Cutaneotrichosporon oleaginosum]|uniref:Proteophosphoglycan ppg4 n=1 Tax=Cutaneotrichosporon oleaginosum TaxID=879819 RepID=A0A0J1B9A9_9TREE|nr:uncharacterized protein CC85DRAFT_300540 [Cutaneotrichosporon oleaginosum]KLT44399.1 hypothetical protein CC85DRAFT_300540 [Cutaneotrichosporon oleaginosum]TXT07879.1 hypothetical protein COLE_04803 [Cutaneotrichosporon oleaginosum]
MSPPPSAPGAFPVSRAPPSPRSPLSPLARSLADLPPPPVPPVFRSPSLPPSVAASTSTTAADEGSDSSASTAARLSTPRKRFIVRSRARPAPSPRRRKKEREEEWEDVRPGMSATLSYLLAPLRLFLTPVQMILTPVLWHILNIAIMVCLVALAFFLAQAWLRRALAAMFSPDSSLPGAVALLPFRALATPACFITGIGCDLSLLTAPNMTARPFWQMASGGAEVDIAAVSRGLSREARQAKDIFESLTALGDGRMTAGLGHVRIHELGIAVQTGSTLEDRFFIGAELIELADLASDITDEVVTINAMSVNVFSWLFWEFSNLVSLLSLPPSQRPSSHRLGARLDSLINRLDHELDRLYLSVDSAIPLAARGRDKGWSLLRQLSEVHSDLKAEHDRFPGWQRALDVSRRFFAGGDPSKLTRISRDLDLTRATIGGIDETSKSLERVRIDLTAFRTQVRSFKGSVMGLHLGASEEIGLGPEQEMQILTGVVEELGLAVGRAKRRPASDDRLIEA